MPRQSASKHVVVALSGGVDSSIAAWKLLQDGYKVSGLFMKNWEEDDNSEYCAAAVDLEDAQAVCDKLNIPLNTINFSFEYWENVFQHFLDEYQAGRTPNPDILCNREIKFKEFLLHAQSMGADFIATGHYARRLDRQSGVALARAIDTNKDQTYFLYAVAQQALKKSLFPLGDTKKTEVREIARHLGMVTHNKKDSTGICFIGERKFRDFLSRYLPARSGNIQDTEGRIIGRHQGAMYYTIGQRQGLGIGGPGEPWYVVEKNVEENVLIAVQGHNHERLLRQNLCVNDLHWISGKPPALPLRCRAKTRYRQQDQPCTLHVSAEDSIEIRFEAAQRAITPGQSAVFYTDDICLGGGIII